MNPFGLLVWLYAQNIVQNYSILFPLVLKHWTWKNNGVIFSSKKTKAITINGNSSF